MEYRPLGDTGLSVSVIGFGCGNVGGLMIRGEPAQRRSAVARAIELGVNYFDTASMYGNGLSEEHLGQALREVGAPVYVGTKVRLSAEDAEDIPGGVTRSVEGSLLRLGRESVDLIQLHNAITLHRGSLAASLSVADVLGEVAEAFATLRSQGKVRYLGITGQGDTAALHQVIDSASLNTVQTPYNLINHSAGQEVNQGFPHQDYGRFIDRAATKGMGVLAIRVLAGGALGGSEERHLLASPDPTPFGSGPSYADDLQRARSLEFLVRDGHAQSMAEASVRFALAKGQVSTVLVGFSSIEHLEEAVAFAARGPLAPEALTLLSRHRQASQ